MSAKYKAFVAFGFSKHHLYDHGGLSTLTVSDKSRGVVDYCEMSRPIYADKLFSKEDVLSKLAGYEREHDEDPDYSPAVQQDLSKYHHSDEGVRAAAFVV